MAEPYIGEIRIFAGAFAPRGWALCNGSELTVSQFKELYTVLGTSFGGQDSQASFGLPDMQGRAPMHCGNGPGLTSRAIGEATGQEIVELTEENLPAHNHDIQASANNAGLSSPGPSSFIANSTPDRLYGTLPTDGNKVALAPEVFGVIGGGAAHPNLQPYLKLNFAIALAGAYPVRSG